MHNIKKFDDLETALSQITNDKFRVFINEILKESEFNTITAVEARVKNVYKTLRPDYERKIEKISNLIICLNVSADHNAAQIYRQIEMICDKSPGGADIDDVNVLFEAHYAGLSYPDLLFITNDYNHILRHKKDLIDCTSLKDIISLFESNC